MHDFDCTQAADMNFELTAERTRYLKENPKGVQEIKIAEYAGLPLDEVKKMKAEKESINQRILSLLFSFYVASPLSDQLI